MAQFGLSEGDIRDASKSMTGYLFDQYVRACGFSPGGSWVLIVLASGGCEFTPLAADEPRWCCEKADLISKRIGDPAAGAVPPWAASAHAKPDRRFHFQPAIESV